MITVVVFLIPLVIGILLTGSDAKIGPVPIKVLGYILAITSGLFLVLFLL